MKLDKSIFFGLILGTVAAVATHAQERPSTNDHRPSTLQEEFHKTYALNPGGRVELKNINGRVKISSWERNEVKVDAVKYAGTKERLAEAEIMVEAAPDAIYIKTRYHNDGPQVFTDDDVVHNPASVDYTLTVPTGARLDAIKLINGDLDIQNMSGEVRASCINGHLRASGLRGRTELSTVNGALQATYDRLNAEWPVALKSVNGRVEVTLPSDASAEVHARTVHGFIDNDFGLPIEERRFSHTLAGRLGAGAAHVEMKNVNGTISLRHAADGKPLSPATNLLTPKRAEMD